MNGGIAEIRNHSRNELPLIRPTMPPARPKQKAMTRNAIAAARSRLEQRARRPDDGDQGHADRDEPRHAGDDADDHLEQEPRGERQDERRDDPHPERGTGLLFHENENTPLAGGGGTVLG